MWFGSARMRGIDSWDSNALSLLCLGLDFHSRFTPKIRPMGTTSAPDMMSAERVRNSYHPPFLYVV